MNKTQYQEAIEATRNKVTVHERINFDKVPAEPVKVSVVIPVCNVEEYLRECLDSAVNQTLREIEIICVNDGSKDGSLAILKEYAAADDRVKVIDKENAGYGHAMNIGMDQASGEYIGIIESDDFADLHMYEDLYRIAKEKDLDVIKADFNRFMRSNGELILQYNAIGREQEYYNRVLNPAEESYVFRFIMNTWSGIYNREFLTQHYIRHNETPGASYQDNGFWFQTTAYAQRFYILNKPYYMNRRDNPNSSVYNKAKVYCMNEEYHYIYDLLTADPELYPRFLAPYQYKKYQSYMTTLRRIAPEFRREYLQVFAEEFNESEEKGELDCSLFSPLDCNTCRWIMRDYEEYYYKVAVDEIRVSVILPVYNVGRYLEQCLQSLCDQTLSQIEIICVDDGSTDNSLEILREFARKDSRVRVIEQENQGAGAARNAGIREAHGKYLSFLDADDYFDENMLREAYNKAEMEHADICIYKAYFFDNETEELSKCSFSVREKLLPKRNTFSRVHIESNIFTSIMGWAWDKLYLRSFVLNQGLSFQVQRTTNDMYFVFASLLKADRITILNKYLYYQRRNVRTSLSKSREKSWECFYHALIKVRDELIHMGIYEDYARDFANYALHSCLWNFNTLKEPTARKLFEKLTEEWFAELGIAGHDADYFDNAGEYEQYQELCALDRNDENAYTQYLLNYWKTRYQYESQHAALSIKVETMEDEVLRVRDVLEKLSWNRDERGRYKSLYEQAERENQILQDELNRLLTGFVSARIDLKNTGGPENDLEIVNQSGRNIRVEAPDWFADQTGTGYIIKTDVDAESGQLSMRLRCKGDGTLVFKLKGMYMTGRDGKTIPYWIDYTGFKVNADEILEEPVIAWHDQPYVYTKKVKDGDIVEFTCRFKSHAVGELM